LCVVKSARQLGQAIVAEKPAATDAAKVLAEPDAA
jgi:hypothetical protein